MLNTQLDTQIEQKNPKLFAALDAIVRGLAEKAGVRNLGRSVVYDSRVGDGYGLNFNIDKEGASPFIAGVLAGHIPESTVNLSEYETPLRLGDTPAQVTRKLQALENVVDSLPMDEARKEEAKKFFAAARDTQIT